MGQRIFLLCAGRTAGAPASRFPADAPLGETDAARTRRVAARLPRFDRIVSSPAAAARATAALIGAPVQVATDLRGQNFGGWSGRMLDAVADETPDAVARWLRDASFAPPGGESFAAVLARIGTWLEGERTRQVRRTLAVTHPEVIRAAVLCVLGAPTDAARAIDVEPLAIAELTGDGRRWALRRFGVRLMEPTGDSA